MGQQRTYTIPKAEWDRLMARFDTQDTISEEDAAKLLGVKPVSLQIARSKGAIPADCYTKPKAGKTVYFKSKLLNIG